MPTPPEWKEAGGSRDQVLLEGPNSNQRGNWILIGVLLERAYDLLEIITLGHVHRRQNHHHTRRGLIPREFLKDQLGVAHRSEGFVDI